MSDFEARRKMLKKLAIGGGVVSTASMTPEKWAKPVLKTSMLPAHAAATKK